MSKIDHVGKVEKLAKSLVVFPFLKSWIRGESHFVKNFFGSFDKHINLERFNWLELVDLGELGAVVHDRGGLAEFLAIYAQQWNLAERSF